MTERLYTFLVIQDDHMFKKIFTILIALIFYQTILAANQTAIFAGGCFWCLESDFDKVPGVVKTISGYDGGQQSNPTYKKVSSGQTNYAESLQVIYNPDKVSYKQLLKYFWLHIDPTVQNAQFCDHGRQYRSAIFYLNDVQHQEALASLAAVKKIFPHVYTEVTASTHFYPAEEYHQNYYKKNPLRYKFYRWNCGRDARVQQVWKNKTIPAF